jgi:hypothetical protein
MHPATPDAGQARAKLAAAIEAARRAEANAEAARQRLYAVIVEVSPALKQAEIVRATGWTREHIRNIAAGRVPGKK